VHRQISSRQSDSLKKQNSILIEGKSRKGKGTRLNQLINAQLLNEWFFLSSIGQERVPSDFQVFGAIILRDFCQQWSIPMTARDTFTLFFRDSEGTRNPNGINEQLGKASPAVSAVIIVRIAMGQNKLCDAFIDGVAMSEEEMSGAMVFMYRDVGFKGSPAISFAEMERRRGEDDQTDSKKIRAERH
jgi:hypothetical protein